MATLEDVKFIDEKTKYFIHGYIRECQLLLPQDSIYFTIPTLVIHWCLLYFHIKECFDTDLFTYSSWELSKNNTRIKKKSTADELIFLSRIAERGIHKWRFRLIDVNTEDYWMCLGVWKAEDKQLFTNACLHYFRVKELAYAWIVNNRERTYGDADGTGRYGEKKCVSGDIVEMILDLNKYELSFTCNGQDFGVAFQKMEKTTYRAVIDAYYNGDEIELISYANY